MSLRGIKPLPEEQRLKVFVYGPAGSGKTLAALQFPDAYIIDTAKETSRYYKQIQKTNSVVFNCSNPYEVIKELEELRTKKHRFQTLVIDEITTLYQNIQTLWTDKFIAAQEERGGKYKASNLLEDFGFRYWDKVKRDWRRLINALRNLDMNVVVNAHQKDKYGSNQQITGIAPDSEKNDEYIWDFVFRLIVRGKEYRAITEKQRALPKEIDPDVKRFPKEFTWDYSNLIKFYNKEYIEKPTKNSQLYEEKRKETEPFKTKELKEACEKLTEISGIKKPTEVKKENKSEYEEITTFQTTGETTNIKPKIKNNIDKIKELIKKENISIKQFKIFLQNVCKWKHVSVLTKLTIKEQNILINNWDTKIMPKFKEQIGNTKEKNKSEKQTKSNINLKEATKEVEKHCEQNYEPKKPIREDQKNTIISKLEKENINVKTFFKGFMIKDWSEINQEGAENMIKNFKTMIGAFE